MPQLWVRRRKTKGTVRAAMVVMALVASAHAWCEVTPTAASTDQRIRWVNYNPNDVVSVVTRFGFSTELRFAPDEIVSTVVVGDSSAVKAAVAGNHLFLKSQVPDERTTNVSVLTSKGREYDFVVKLLPVSASPKLGTYFTVALRYPDDQKAASKKVNDAEKLKQELAHPVRHIRNIDYFACGDTAVTPDQAFDDGRFTYLRFAGSRPTPAIYAVQDDGSEEIVQSHAETDSPDTIVVYQLTKKMVFRLGTRVGCLVNKNYNPKGVDTFNGTVSPDVKRVVKDAN